MFLSLCIVAACTGAHDTTGPASAPNPLTDVSGQPGAYVYQQRCAGCHEKSRASATEYYPELTALAQSLAPLGMAKAVLSGKFDRAGEIGGVPIPVMPAHDHLANETIADVVNYIYEHAEERASPITAEDVARLRAERPSAGTYLTDDQYQLADRIFHERCVSCHGVDRHGRSGAALHRWAMQERGDEALKTIIHFGTSWGMPNWGTADQLSPEDIALLARYLQLPPSKPRPFGWREIVGSWWVDDAYKTGIPETNRRNGLSTKDLFVSLLHDSHQIALFDAEQRSLIAFVDGIVAPQQIDRSTDGRILYVVTRGAEIYAVDLEAQPIRIFASTKAGFEGGVVAVHPSDDAQTILVGAKWPSQAVAFAKNTLEPQQRYDVSAGGPVAESAVTHIAPLNEADRFVISTQDRGQFHLVGPGHPPSQVLDGAPFLRSGSPDTSGRYLLTPTDDSKVVVFDMTTESVSAILAVAGLVGGSSGTAYSVETDTRWTASSLGSNTIVSLSTRGAPHTWSIAEAIDVGAGSITIASHQNSPHVLVDFPLHQYRNHSRSIGVLNKSSLTEGARLLPVVDWAGLGDEEFARAIHPQFNADGTAIWITVWNRQDRRAAIVVLNAQSLEVIDVIDDVRLRTPTRTFFSPAG